MLENKAETLYNVLREQVTACVPGTRMNSFRRCMQKYNVSLSTVSRAVEMLRQQNLVDVVHGRGIFTTGNTIPRKKMHAVEIVFFGNEYSLSHHGYIRDLVHHLSVGLGAKNVSTRITLIDNRASLKQTAGILNRLDLENVITLSLPNMEVLEYLKSRRLPYVCISPDVPHKMPNSVYLDNARIMELIFSHLTENGHREIAYLHILQDDFFSMDKSERYNGFFRECARHGIVPDLELIKFGGYMAADTRKAFAGLLDSGHPFTAVIGNDHTVSGIYQEMAARKLKVGEDIAVIGNDYLEINQGLVPPLTSIKISRAKVAETAIRMMEDAFADMNYQLPCITVEPELIAGETVKKLTELI